MVGKSEGRHFPVAGGTWIAAVVAQNDEMAMGAYKALEAVEQGRLAATVFQDARAQGRIAIELANETAKGEPVEHRNYIPF